jgi:predicted acyltransferase
MTKPEAAPETATDRGGTPAGSGRLVSLDVFRGLTIAAMVLVNNQLGPGAYTTLRHADWSGWTFTDTIFPAFLWIAGLATTLSTAKRFERGATRGTLIAHAARRAAVLFALGLALNFAFHPDLATARIPGVLQRIAICYFAGTVIYLYSGVRGRLYWIIGLCAVYWIAMAPSGYEQDSSAAAQLDRFLMQGHLYRPNDDPEGALSTLPSIGTFLFGLLAGDLLRKRWIPAETAAWMLVGGNALIFLGVALDAFQPINKALWTVPFTVLMAGLSFVVFGCCYWVMDGKRFGASRTHPSVMFGVNALAVYVFHELVSVLFGIGGDGSLRHGLAGSLGTVFDAANTSLIYSLLHVGMSFGLAWVLWRRRWMIKL